MSGDAPRRARIRTTHADAEAVAAALAPDNTDQMETSVEGETVTTTIDRDSTGGLHATVDDYVVNLHVAEQCTTTNDPNDNT